MPAHFIRITWKWIIKWSCRESLWLFISNIKGSNHIFWFLELCRSSKIITLTTNIKLTSIRQPITQLIRHPEPL
jgi:hypothetical protein